MRKLWSSEELAYLKNNYANTVTAEIATYLDRSLISVYAAARVLGLKKSAEFMASEKSGRLTTGTVFGLKTQFKKGQSPLNKGKKVDEKVYQALAPNFFKKGAEPHNTLHDGAIVVRSDKKGNTYVWIRISKANWKMLHIHQWEQEHGPVPKGKIVVFKDKNPMHTNLANYELITRKENMLRNTIQRYPEDLQKLIKLNHKLKNTINEKQSN